MEIKLEVEPYEEPIHYPILVEWWGARGLPIPPPVLLPYTGVVGRLNGEPSVALFAYEDVWKPVAHLDWLVGRPGLRLEQSRPLILNTLERLVERLREIGVLAIIANAEPAIARYFEQAGFEEQIPTTTTVKILT